MGRERHPPSKETDTRCLRCGNERTQRKGFPTKPTREKPRLTRGLGISRRRSLFGSRAKIVPRLAKEPLQQARANSKDDQGQPVGSGNFVGNGIENDSA